MLDKGELLLSQSQIFQQRDRGNLGKCDLELDLLKDYKAHPALNGQSWAEENWHSLGVLVEKIKYLAKKKKKNW